MSKPSTLSLEGKILQGKYQLGKRLGAGGMACVFQATDLQTGQLYAAKILLPHLNEREEIRHRFLREIRILTKFDHPNIIRVHDFIQEGDLVGGILEHCDSGDLAAWMKQERGLLQSEQLLSFFPALIDAVQYAHQNGVIHRDLKPPNILLTSREDFFWPKLTDFGVAKALFENEEYTQAGEALGTLSYMAPEQLEDSKNADERSDIYSLGVLLYRLSTGRRPFPLKQAAAILQILNSPPEDPYEAPKDLQRVILRCMEKNPNDRFQSCAELKEAVLGALGAKGKVSVGLKRERHMSPATVPTPMPTAEWLERFDRELGSGKGPSAFATVLDHEAASYEQLEAAAKSGQYSSAGSSSGHYASSSHKLSAPPGRGQILPSGQLHGQSNAELSASSSILPAPVQGMGSAEHSVAAMATVDESAVHPEGLAHSIKTVDDMAGASSEHILAAGRQTGIRQGNGTRQRPSFIERVPPAELLKAAQERELPKKKGGSMAFIGFIFFILSIVGTYVFLHYYQVPDEARVTLHQSAVPKKRFKGDQQSTRKGVATRRKAPLLRRKDLLRRKGPVRRRSGQKRVPVKPRGILGTPQSIVKGEENGRKAPNPDALKNSKQPSLLQKACDGGSGASCNNLGVLYQYGRGVKRSTKKAAHLYRRGCFYRVRVACNNLGLMFWKGSKGFSKNVKAAGTFFEKACKLEHAGGCFHRGLLALEQKGRKKYGLARTFFLDACTKKYGPACFRLGYLYHRGKGVRANCRLADSYYRRACRYGFKSACSLSCN